MSRELLTILVPLFLPTALYFAWIAVMRKVAVAGNALPPFPWVWLLVSGVALVALTLFVFNVHFGRSEEGNYIAPHTENGRVVPGRVVPASPARP